MLAGMDGSRLGRSIRALRRKRGWTQAELARRSGLSQSAVSRIERGGGTTLAVRTLERVTAEVGARLRLTILADGEDLDRLLDAGHAAIVEHVTQLLLRHGWEIAPETTFSVWGERGSIDVLAFHPPTGSLLVIEVKGSIHDVQGTLAGIDRKARLAAEVARDRGWRVRTVSRWLVAPGDTTTRRRVTRHEATFRAVLPLRSAELRRWLASPSGATAGILFVSPSTVAGTRHRIGAKRGRSRAA